MLSTSFVVEVKDQLSCTFEIMRFLSILIGETPGVVEFEEQNHVYATDRESVSENDLDIGDDSKIRSNWEHPQVAPLEKSPHDFVCVFGGLSKAFSDDFSPTSSSIDRGNKITIDLVTQP